MDLKSGKSKFMSNYTRWENPLNKRYYIFSITKDLLNVWVVIRAWGSKSTAYGRILYTPCSSYEEACDLVQFFSKIRLKRGYRNVSYE